MTEQARSEQSKRQPPSDRGVRLHWPDMPRRLRSEVEEWLGGKVLFAATQPTGFSPGIAAVLTTDDDRQVFIKAVGPAPNPITPTMHRREIKVVSAMPDETPVPRLLWSYDEGEDGWVVMVFEHVAGLHPAQPWRTGELDRVIVALENLSATLTPSPLPTSIVGTASDMFATEICGWRRILDERQPRVDCLDEWSRRHIETLAAIEGTAADALAGNSLLHMDIRADNILLTSERVWFLDWPHACKGPSWLDVVAFAPSVTMQGGPTPEKVISKHSACRAAECNAITAAVVSIAGYFTRQGLLPSPPGLPTVREFQRAQGLVARKWAAQRTGLF